MEDDVSLKNTRYKLDVDTYRPLLFIIWIRAYTGIMAEYHFFFIYIVRSSFVGEDTPCIISAYGVHVEMLEGLIQALSL